ncbi:MAG: YhdP family protein [Methylococcales bacterium]|nr:YhdP family protein [Methylococcales bacterium]
MPHPLSRHAHNVALWTLLFFTLSFLGVNFLFSGIESYKNDLSRQLSDIIQAPVKIGKLSAKLHGIAPQIQLSELDIANEKIHLSEIRLGVDVFQFLSTQNLLSAATITLVDAKITLVRHADDSITLEGLKASEGQPTWLLQGNYSLLHSSITWRDDKLKTPVRQIAPVNLAILNDGGNHRVNLLAQLQKNEPLRVSLDFSGNPFDLKTLNGKIYFESKNLKLSEFSEFELPLNLKIQNGVANLKAWATLKNGEFQTLNGDAKFQNVALNRPQHSVLKFNQISSNFQIEKQNETWLASLLNLDVSMPETALNGALSLAVNENNSAENSVGLFLRNVELAPLIPIANFFAEKDIELNKFSGTLENLRLFTQPKLEKFAVDGKFTDLKINVADLNFQHLNGHLHGNEQAGTLFLEAEKLALHAPTLFREVLPEIELKTTLNWLQTPEAWQISSDKIVLNNRDIPSESALKLTLPKNGEPFMDLQTAFEIHDATQTWRYLPVGIMEKDVVEWLDKAFEKGQVKNGQFLFYGLLKDFPFEKNNGVFEVIFDAENGRLNYAPDWLPLDNLTAQVRFYQDSLQVNLSGMAQNATLKSAEVTIPSMFTSNYVGIIGEAEGEISQVLSFMQKTPLKSRVDSVLTAIAPVGKTDVSLDLQIALAEKFTSKVKGSALFQNAKLKVKSLDLPVQAISGELKFTEQGVFSDRIDAVALNRPIQVRLQSSDTQTSVNVVGSTSVEDLFSQLNILPLTKLNEKTTWIDGLTDYQLTLALPYAKTPPTLQIQSMLAGITLNLPAELAKAKLQKIPFSMTLTLGDETFLPLTMNYNERLKAAVNLDTKNKKIERGAILLGDGKIDLSAETGLSLKISRNDLALQDWLGLAAASSENNADSIHTVVIHSQNARWKNADLGAFDLVLKRENEAWRGELKSDFATGIVQLKNNSALKLELEKLDLAIFKQFQSSASENPPQPPFSRGEQSRGFSLSLQSLQTFWHDKPLGKLNIETTQTETGIQFKTVDLQATTHHLSMTGESGLQTKLSGTLEFFKAGLLFSNLGITKDVAETNGNAKLNLNWQGSPQEFGLEKLRGAIDLDLQNGRILSIEPGFGRILGVLALEQWLKRIQLDFSDVYSEGLTFDSINGHFDISQGKASTQNLTVDAIPAKILLKGDTDFVHENVDYLVDVTPKSADAVPIAGTIVGKIMSLVGKTLTGENQDGFFFGSQYQVKGSWGNVDVIPMHENDGLIQKTWHGITDFSWLKQKLNSKEVRHD